MIAGLDLGALLALIALGVAIVGAVGSLLKARPEAASIATKTTLEVNEALREELKEVRREARETRSLLVERESELEDMKRKVAKLRTDVEALEDQLSSVQGYHA